MCLSPHSTISAFILLLFPCSRHSNNHTWLFFPAHISQMGPEMGIFPPSWWYTCRSCGRFKEMAASLCFLGAGCGPLLYLALAQQLLRQAQEHLGHPYSVLPTCAHSHRMIKVGGSQLTRVQGSGPDWKKIGALCQCGSYNMSYSGSQGLSSQAQQLSQAWLEASWPQAHTQTQKRTRLLCFTYSKHCILMLHKSWTGMLKYGNRKTKTAQAYVWVGVNHTFTLAWILEPQSKSDVAGSGNFTQSYERQYRSNCKARMGPRINNHPQNV